MAATYEDVDNDQSLSQHLLKSVSIPQPESMLETSISMANLEGEPSAFINGHVNVITGDFNDFQVDLTLPGVDSLTVERSFSGSTRRKGSLAAGWNLNLYGTLDCAYDVDDGERFFQVLVTEGHGATSIYKKILNKKKETVEGVPISLDRRVYRKGVTNTSAGYISGQTNIRNNKVCNPSKNVYQVTNGAKMVKIYGIPSSESIVCCLYKEFKPSGNFFRYHYLEHLEHINSHWRTPYDVLGQVELKSPDNRQLAVVDFVPLKSSEFKKFPHQDVIAGDGRKVCYHFEIRSKRDRRRESLLTKIERTDVPTESYQYIEGEKDVNMLIRRKDRPDGRYMKIKYYREGNNLVGQDLVKISKRDIFRINRVRALQAPVGSDDTPINTHRFYYDFDPVRFGDTSLSRSGSTTVLDALNNKSVYIYGRDQRLKHIDKFSSDGNLYSRESLYWANYRSEQCTYLLSRSLASASGCLAFARTYSYDDRGNVLQDSLYGNLSGHSGIAPIISKEGAVTENGCERFQKQFKYSDNGFNLLQWESDGMHETSYEYEWESNKLSAKFIGEPNKIHLREFYEYNIEAALTKKIVDDGFTKDKNNLAGVTERHITYYTPRTTYPFGCPEVIIEKYLDVASGQEILKNKVVNTHNNQGLLVKQMLYDSTDTYLYTLYWDYNPMGKLIREVDALQNVSEWRYDPNGNCIFEQGPDLNVHKDFTYDYANRLVRQDEVHSDGVRKSISYRYNLLSQPVAISDYHGNETLYDYDAFGRVTHITYPTAMNEDGVLTSPTIKKSYDLMGNVTNLIDGKGNEKTTTYTIRGQVAKVTYPDGSSESNVYTMSGQLQSSCSKNGTITSFTYDALGRTVKTEITSLSGEILSITSASYNAFHIMSETDAMGQATYYIYYPDGKLKSKRSGDSLSSCTYDAIGRLKSSCAHYGPNPEDVIIKTQEYDLLNRVIEERTEGVDGVIFSKVNYTYDFLGRVSETRSGNGSISSAVYDSHGTPIISTDSEGNQTRLKCSFDHVNLLGQRVDCKEVIDAFGNATTTICDALGRVVSITRRNSLGEVLQKQESAYDLNGNNCRLTDTIISKTSERVIVTKLSYDMFNRLIACYEAADTPEQKCTQINYNLFGQKTSIIKADGTSLNYTYDDLGRLASLSSSDNTIHYAYTYDLNNHPLKVDDLIRNTATIKEYDDSGRITKEILGHGFSLKYDYDAMGLQLMM